MRSQVARQTVLEGKGDHVGVYHAVVVMAGTYHQGLSDNSLDGIIMRYL